MALKRPDTKKVIKGASALSLGVSVAVAIAFGTYVGMLMRDYFDKPWLLWLGVFWGFGGAFLNVHRAYKGQLKEFEELANDPKHKAYEEHKKQQEAKDEK